MVQIRPPKSRSSTSRFSDSDSDSDSAEPPRILPLSAFKPPSDSSEGDGFNGRPQKKKSRLEDATWEPSGVGSSVQERREERSQSSAVYLTAGDLSLPNASSSEQLQYWATTHAEARSQPVSPSKASMDQPQQPYAPIVPPAPQSSSTSNLDSRNVLSWRLGGSRDGSTSQSRSQDASKFSQRPGKAVRFAETNSSEDDRRHGRKKKKIRR